MAISIKNKTIKTGNIIIDLTGTVYCRKCGKYTKSVFSQYLRCSVCKTEIPTQANSVERSVNTRLLYYANIKRKYL